MLIEFPKRSLQILLARAGQLLLIGLFMGVVRIDLPEALKQRLRGGDIYGYELPRGE